MEVLKLPLQVREQLMKAENEIKVKYLNFVRSLSFCDLKKFDKVKYKDIMLSELSTEMNGTVSIDILESQCHCMSNALNNECQAELGKRHKNGEKTPRKSRNNLPPKKNTSGNTINSVKNNVDDIVLSVQENLDLGELSESMNELFISQNEPSVVCPSPAENFDDSITEVKTLCSEEQALEITPNQEETVQTRQKAKKAKKGQKGLQTDSKNSCICKSNKTGNMIRCNLCQLWFHVACVLDKNDSEVGFWENNRLRDSLTRDKKQENECECTTKLNNHSCKKDDLRDKQRNIAENSKPHRGTLLVGSSVIRDITTDAFKLDNQPLCVRGGRVSDITAELLSKPVDEVYKNIILQIGSNDCASNLFDEESFRDDYQTLVMTAKRKCENVVISSICPRLDDRFGNIRLGNIVLSKIACDENCLYIEHDDDFRLPNCAINSLLYNRDGVHLNKKGSVKLANSLDIFEKQVAKQVTRPSNARKSGGAPQRGYQRNNRQAARQSKPTATRNAQHVRYERHSQPENRRHNETNEDELSFWYCGEGNHISKNCRHGQYLQCKRCNEYGHKLKHCNL
ncbi:unnamed protein product [Mytilus coruscus]|uniref:CCHC-type domain-containing protein n=1 Tax=Mytilus coruscus TaxID=42192 RepID=A0A6J8D1C6_MYTCO|nr:unnamed protein product [Mytilus coruscus]